MQSFANPLAQNFQNQMMQNVNQMYNQAQTPVYGNAQIAQNLQGLNQLANSSIKSLQGALARTGGMSGGGQAQGISNILQNKGNQAFNFTSQLPMLNQQAKMAGEGQAVGLGNQLQSQFLRNTSQTGMNQGSSTGNSQSVTQNNPSIMSDIGQVTGIAGAAMGMPALSGMMGGGGGGAAPQFGDWYNNGAGGNMSSPMSAAPAVGPAYNNGQGAYGVGGGVGIGSPQWWQQNGFGA